MNILVYGAGAVGGYLGASLAHGGNQVTLIVRPDTLPVLQREGLRLLLPEGGEIRTRPTLVTSVRQAFLEGRNYDGILLAMKSYDVAEALNPLVAFAPEPLPLLVTVQNGIGIEEMVQKEFEGGSVLAASLTTPLQQLTPGQIRVEHGDRGLALAPTQRKQPVKTWANLFEEAGVTTETVKDYRAMKWSKALLNMIGNASSAILNRHPAAIYEVNATFRLEMEMLQEALAVMKGLGVKVVDLPGTPTKRLSFAVRRLPDSLVKPVLGRMVASGRGNKMPSFHIDLAAGRRANEVVYHNGAVAAAGRELDIPTPVNAAFNDILLGLVRRQIDWKIYDGNPQRLVEEVQRYRQRAR